MGQSVSWHSLASLSGINVPALLRPTESRRLLSLTDVSTNFTLIIRYTILIFLAITVTLYDEFYIQFLLVIKINLSNYSTFSLRL